MVPRRCTLYWENLKRADDGRNNVKAGIMQGCDVGSGRVEEEGRNLHFSRCQRKTRGHFWFREMPQTRQRRELVAFLKKWNFLQCFQSEEAIKRRDEIFLSVLECLAGTAGSVNVPL